MKKIRHESTMLNCLLRARCAKKFGQSPGGGFATQRDV